MFSDVESSSQLDANTGSVKDITGVGFSFLFSVFLHTLN